MRTLGRYQGDARNKAQILAAVLIALLVFGLGYEAYYSIVMPERRSGFAAYALVLATLGLLLWGKLRAASIMTIAVFPVGITGFMVIANPIVNPSAVLQFLVIDLFLCAVLFGVREVLGMTIVNAGVMVGLWYFLPDRVRQFSNLPLSPNIAAGLVLSLYAHYRGITNRAFREAILNQESDFRNTLEGTKTGIWTWRLDNRTMIWSDNVYRAFGVSQDVFGHTIKSFLNAVFPEDRPRIKSIISRAASGEQRNYAAQFRIVWPDKSIHWIDVRGHAFLGPDNRTESMRGTIVDITEEKQREQELQQSRMLVEGIAQASPLIMYVYDLKAKARIYSNRRLVLELGYTREEVDPIGEAFVYSLLHPDDAHVLANLAARWDQVPDDQILESEYRLRDKTGRYRWFAGRDKVFRRGPDGKVTQIIGTAQDVTERREFLDELTRSEEKYRMLVETAWDGIFLLSSDGLILELNLRGAEMVGFQRDELLGKSPAVMVDPAELAKRPVGLGEIALGQTQIVQRRFRHKNGKLIDVEISVRRLPDGRFLSVVRDISERLQSESALAKGRRRWEFLMQNAPIFVILINEGGKILDLNQSVEGLPIQSVIGHSLYEFILPEFAQTTQEAIQRAASGHAASLELKGPGANGTSAWYATNVGLVDETPEGKTLLLMCTDITGQKERHEQVHRLNEELEKRVAERTVELEVVNRELESFSYSVSHDLRAPLRGIDGWSLALEEDYVSHLDETAKTYIHRVRGEAKRMDALIQDLLRLSRVSRTEMRWERVDLSAMANERIEAIVKQGPGRAVKWIVESGMTAIGDPGLIEILLDNLLENAWKFTGNVDDALIEFGLSANPHDGRGQVFYVKDNGAGFDMAFAGRLFAPFQRQHTVSEFPGTGIGLATVQRIVRRHGGKIWAESAVHQGAIFYFTLGAES